MASILCPKCKNPLNIPRPAPEKIVCGNCGSRIKNHSYKPGSNGSSAALGSTAPLSADAGSGNPSQGVTAKRGVPVPVAAVAGPASDAAIAQAVAEPRVAKNLASPPPDTEPASAPPDAPSGNKMALYLGAGGAAAVVLIAVAIWAMTRGGGTPAGKKDDPNNSGQSANGADFGKSKAKGEDLFDPRKAADIVKEDIDALIKKSTTKLVLKKGEPITGTLLSKGKVYVMAVDKGKEVRVNADDVEELQEGEPLSMEEVVQLQDLKMKYGSLMAIQKGTDYLRKQIPAALGAAPNARPGAVALLGLTLLECGASRDDPDVEKVAALLRDAMLPESPLQLNNPYDIAPTIFFFDRLYKNDSPSAAGDKKIINSLALRLLRGQRRPYHFWRYNVPVLTPEQEENAKEEIRNKRLHTDTINDQDLSCSQFAALGLWTAKRHGIPMEDGFDPIEAGVKDALEKAGIQAREQQQREGFWNYGASDHGSQFIDTSTCCGLILMCLGEGVKPTPRSIKQDLGVKRGLKHLEKVIKNNKNPRQLVVNAHGGYYFLWALERTALIMNEDRIGEEEDADGNKGQDWHKWGTAFILNTQNGAGGWSGGNGEVADTCFAMLFLRRVNLFKDLTQKLAEFAMAPLRQMQMCSAPGTPKDAQVPVPGRPTRNV